MLAEPFHASVERETQAEETTGADAPVQARLDDSPVGGDVDAELEVVMADLTDEEKASVRQAMEEAGWRKVTVAEFLDLTPEDMAVIEVRRAVASALAEKSAHEPARTAATEEEIAPTTLDDMVRAFFATGATQADLARVLAG